MSALRRSCKPRRGNGQGFVLIALLVLLTMGGLYFLVNNLTPEAIEARRQEKTEAALALARDALIGYALQYRDQQMATGTLDAMYGFLPMPDVGTSRFHASQSPSCNTEGCAMSFVNGAFPAETDTVIGRLPWRTLGTGPLLDGYGECLWYAVSAAHKSLGMSASAVMNWDTLGQIDIVTTHDSASLKSLIKNSYDRPVAVIFSAGPKHDSQNRGQIGSDVVTQCQGNYSPANYLDPNLTSTILDNDAESASTYASGTVSTTTSSTNLLAISMQGKIVKEGTDLKSECPAGRSCSVVANDKGLTITGNTLFEALRNSSYFRTDINGMLSAIEACLNRQITKWDDIALPTYASPRPFDFEPLIDNANAPLATPDGKTIGRLKTCFSDAENPMGYFKHYRNHVFLAGCDSGSCIPATIDGVAKNCAAVVIFAGQRSASQSRGTKLESFVNDASTSHQVEQRNNPANYLEGINLDSFKTTGSNVFEGFEGDSEFRRITSGQVASRDIVRCISGDDSPVIVSPSVAAAAGSVRLASYTRSTGTLTLGSAAINSNYGANAAQLYSCAWAPEVHDSGSGFRSYFRFRIRQVGEGFTYAVIDGDRNSSSVCGAARQHLGYSGNNGVSPYIQWPKLAVEFDTARNSGFSEPPTLSNGRNDPCYQGSCGSTQNLASNAHVAVVYWGYAAADGTIPVTQAMEDDNVHGFPWPPDSSTKPAPRNPYPIMPYPTPAPDPAPGVAPLDRMGATSPASTVPAKREFHARIEVTRSFTTPIDAKDGAAGIRVQVWIEPHIATNISSMTYNAGSPPSLTITAAGHGYNTGDRVVIKDAVPAGFNGEFSITRIDADSFTASLPTGTPDPGRYISAISWSDSSGGTDQATVTSIDHGLNTGDSISIAGAVPAEYNGTWGITRIDADSYRFGLELSYEPGDMSPASAAAKALTPHAIALANTTRPMSQLDSSFKPIISDTATIYDEPMSACAGSAPLCPSGQSCGTDNLCYRPSFRNLRLGFTIGERATSSTSTARGQLIEIKDQVTTWLQ
jgi:hypothetical protein